jgi:signal transduction histidine kinase
LSFGALAVVVDAGPLIPDERTALWEEAAIRLLLGVLVLFPYLLYRFAVSFRPPSRRLSLIVGSITAVVLGWTFVLPDIPADGESWPASFVAYVAAFTVHWTLLTIVVTWRLWTAGRGEASVARKRMRLLALAAASITLSLLIAVGSPNEGSAASLASTVLSTLSAAAFLLGLAPPALLRVAWRRPEQARLQAAIADLMRANSPDDVVERVLPPMAQLVAAHAVELRDADGNVLGTHGDPSDRTARSTTIPTATGEITVWTTPYTPFFGADELGALRTLAALTALAFDRARLFAHEREARVALERADEIKTNFIALAAHELRTPAATVHGLVETIQIRRTELDEMQLLELETVLREQTARMKTLVEQLLDLSRLEAEAVAINPQPLAVRPRVEEIVSGAAGDRAAEVEIEVDPRLVAELDSDALDRILSNLVVNALRYGDTPVTVVATQNDRHFRLTVEDCGAGVPAEFVPDLFERFTRSKESRLRPGTGLGLAIARSYAHAHRGDLIYEPAHPRGSRFQLVLPVR